jgi:subtilisin family serine protease
MDGPEDWPARIGRGWVMTAKSWAGTWLVAVAGLAPAGTDAPVSYLNELQRLETLADEIDSHRQQVAQDFQAAIDAKDRCTKESWEEAKRIIERMEQTLKHVDPMKNQSIDLYISSLGGAVTGPEVARARDLYRRYADATAQMRQQIQDAKDYDPCRDRKRAQDQEPYREPVLEPSDVTVEGPKGKDINAISKDGQTVARRVIETPPEGEDGDMREVGPNDEIKKDRKYIVAATCHKPVVVAGEVLAKDRQVELEHRKRTLYFEPCANDAEALEKLKQALPDIDLGGYDYVVLKKPGDPGCFVKFGPKDRAVAALAPGCPDDVGPRSITQILDDAARKSGWLDPINGEPPAQDDPSVDDTNPRRADPKSPIIETDEAQEGKPAPAALAADPLFASSRSWGKEYADQWGLHRIGLAPGREPLWPEKAEPVLVAVIDTGVDHWHPELLGALWYNEREIPGNDIDDDGNGYVDDIHGWNFADRNNDVSDLNGHGTVVAGIIAAATGNGRGIAGVNPWARIMPVKVGDWLAHSWNFEIADAIRYAADNGAKVINVSYGSKKPGPLSRVIQLAVAHARRKGALIVVAAGNEGVDVGGISAAGLAGVITVAGTDPQDQRAFFSNWGGGVDIAAPAVDILSLRARATDPMKFWRRDYQAGSAVVGRDRGYYRLTGTSFAAPFVSGVASLIRSTRPQLTDKQVARMLLHSARDVDTPGWDQFTGYGLLDARAALAADPEFYLLSRILDAAGQKTKDGFVIEVSGRARADKFKRAWVEAGQGAQPKEWTRVSEDVAKPVDDGPLASIPISRLRGAKEWTLRLIVEHENGSRREARFALTLG